MQDAASIRCIYAYLQQGTSDGQFAYLVKISRGGGPTWEPLEYICIAQSVPTPYKTTYGFLVQNEGYDLPATRRLPDADYGIVLTQPITGSGSPQTVYTASYGVNRLGREAGKFVFIDLGGPNEEYVKIISTDQTTRRSKPSSRRTTPTAGASAPPSGPFSTRATTWPSTSSPSPRRIRDQI